MKSKKLLCLILALALVLALGACSKTGDGNDPSEPSEPSEPGDDGNDDNDGSSDAPDLTYFSDGIDENGHFAGLRALDYVTLPDIATLTLPTFEKLTDRAVEDGDFVNIDYVGSVDGVEFEGGTTGGNGTDVVIGVTSYIDDFLAQIVGHKPGENFDIEVTFPDPYQDEDLAGKDAVFNITVNFIWDVTDEAATALGFDGRDGMAQYVGSTGYGVEETVADPDVVVYLSAAKCDSVPDSVLETVKAQVAGVLEVQASQYGLDKDTFAMYAYGSGSADEYVAAQAASQAKWYLIFQAVAEQEELTATDEDITDREYEGYVDVYGVPYMKFSILQEKAIEYIEDNLE